MVLKKKATTKTAPKSVLEGKSMEDLRGLDKSKWSREDLEKYALMLQNS